MFLSFAPFIAFFVFASFATPLDALYVALAISIVLTGLDVWYKKNLKILTVGSIVLFVAAASFILAVMPNVSADVVRLFVNGGLMLVALLSLVVGTPFTLQYAKEQVPEQYWTAPLFIRTNQIITTVWTLAFAIGTAATAASMYQRTIPGWSEIVVAIAALVAAIWFTSLYPKRVRRSSIGDPTTG
jgi:hypothetical protein